jgi:curved DNA-binding protein CbpA
MIPKDYYIILGIKKTADAAEIKRTYRKLAMKYHPDKNPGDALSASFFTDIAEAYKTLSSPAARREYDYNYSGDLNAQTNKSRVITKEDVVNGINNLQKTVAASNIFRINQDALFFQLSQLLAPSNIMLLKENSAGGKTILVDQLLYCFSPLSYGLAHKLSDALLTLAGDDGASITAVNRFLQQSLRNSRWNKYKIWVAVGIAVLLCLLIFLIKTPSAS